MTGILVMLSVGALLGVSAAQKDDVGLFKNCSTGNNATGICIELLNCGSMVALLSTAHNNTEDRDYLRASRCGGTRTNVFICCPVSESQRYLESREDLLPGREECGQQASRGNIVGGNETFIDEFPWTVQLRYKNTETLRNSTICSGALINRNHFVTAAHCVKSELLNQKKLAFEFARLGEWDTTLEEDCDESGNCADPIVDVPVAEVIVHEEFDPMSLTRENDIALVRLSREIEYTQFIRPICLPITPDLLVKNYDGVTLSATGWGKTETASRSNVKLKIHIDGVNGEQCTDIYKEHGVTLTEKHLCAGGVQGIDTCNGDSGGPLMGYDESDRSNKAWYLAGLVLLGPPQCGTPGQPGVYTRTSSYISWILNRLK